MNMKEIDFTYIWEYGETIYTRCFSFLFSMSENITESEQNEMAHKTEEIFFFLVEQGSKNGYNVDAILEISDKIGNTCLDYASQRSKKICNYILQRDIRVSEQYSFGHECSTIQISGVDNSNVEKRDESLGF